MSEKVLGFRKKDERLSKGKGYWSMFPKKKQVSVCLASESVDLKELKEYCKKTEKNRSKFPNTAFIWVDDLIEWAEKEAGK